MNINKELVGNFLYTDGIVINGVKYSVIVEFNKISIEDIKDLNTLAGLKFPLTIKSVAIVPPNKSSSLLFNNIEGMSLFRDELSKLIEKLSYKG